MNFDTVTLAAVSNELAEAALGARIDKIAQPEPLELLIALYKNNYRCNLLISCDPNSARLHLVRGRRRPNPTIPPAFCMLLRKYLEGGTVIEISQPLGFCERVLKISVRTSERETVGLWVEVMGRQSNVVLVSEAGIILGCIKRVTSEMSRFREIRTGIPYAPPPKQLGYKRDPMEPLASFGVPAEPFISVEDAEKWLAATFKGVGTLIAKEAVLRSPDGDLTGETAWYGLNEVLNTVRLGDYHPVVYTDTLGQIVGAYPFPLKSIPAEQQRPIESISEALEEAYDAVLGDDTIEKQRAALLSSLRKAAKSAVRQLLDIREGLLSSEQADYLRENGDLLLANIGKQPAGSNEIIVEDYYASVQGVLRTVQLDPKTSIKENADRYYRRSRKAKDSKEFLSQRLIELESGLKQIEGAITEAESVTTLQSVQALAASIGGEIPQSQSTGTKDAIAKPSYEGHKIKSVKTPDGWEILVGENSTSNDYLTTKVASPNDIWLHARAVPSAHAVIRSQNRPMSVSLAAILLAAEQVARRSQAKHAGLVSVDYTLKKYVRKPRGSAPGQVTYTNEKTIDVIASEE